MARINVAIALDRNVLFAAYVTIRSLAKNNSVHQIYVYVLHSELTKEDCESLRDALLREMRDNQMIFIEVDPSKFSNLPYNRLWSREMYYRLMLPELLGEEIDRILYLDTDIIVNKDISDFYNIDFEEKLLITTKDMNFEDLTLNQPDSGVRDAFFKKLVKEDGMIYFCSGVLLLNLAKLKERYTFDAYMDIFHSISDKVLFPDQDLLNYAHYKQVKFVDEIQFGLFAQAAHNMGMTYEEVRSNVSILHFAGQAKPWTNNLVRYDIEEIWWDYAKDSPFYIELLETVFYNSVKSRFVEDKFQELVDENNALKDLLGKCQEIIQKLS